MAYGPQPYIPVKPIVKRGYFEPPILGVPPAPGTVPAPGFAQVQGLVNQGLVQQPITGQLPLTRSLPQGAGVTMRELPYELPTIRAVPSSIPVGAGQGTSAQALSGLYDAPINPQVSRTIRGNWATPEFTPSASTSNVGSLMRGPAGPSGLPSVYADLPAPPTSTLPPPPGAAAESAASAGSKFNFSGMGYVPASISSSLPKFATTGINAGTGLLISGLAQKGMGAIDSNPQFAGSDYGQILRAGLEGTSYGAFGGPQLAALSLLGGLGTEAGFQSGKAQRAGVARSPYSIPGAIVNQLTDNQTANQGMNAVEDAGLSMIPVVGPAYNVAKTLGSLVPEGTANELRANTIGKLPFVGDFFGGGGEDNAQAQGQQGQGQQAAPLGPETIVDTASKMGVGPQYVQALLDNANAEIAYQMASPTITPDTSTAEGQALVKQLEAAGIKGQDGTYTLPEEVIRATAYQNALSQLPVMRQQEQTNQDFARRTAALQAEIASRLGEWTQGMSPEMATALTTQAMSYPQYMAMQQQSDTNRQIAAQIQNAWIRQQLEAQLPGLFGQGQTGSSSDLSALLGSGS